MSPSAIAKDDSPQDTIAQLSEPISTLTTISPLVSILALAYKVKTPSPTKQDRLSSLMYTLATLDHESPKHTHEEFRNSFIRLLTPVLNGMAGLQEFEEAVGASSDPEDFRDFWTLEGRNLIRDFVQDGTNGGASPGADIPFLETFVEDANARVALGKENSQLVLVPGDAKTGDEVSMKTILSRGSLAFRESSLASQSR